MNWLDETNRRADSRRLTKCSSGHPPQLDQRNTDCLQGAGGGFVYPHEMRPAVQAERVQVQDAVHAAER